MAWPQGTTVADVSIAVGEDIARSMTLGFSSAVLAALRATPRVMPAPDQYGRDGVSRGMLQRSVSARCTRVVVPTFTPRIQGLTTLDNSQRCAVFAAARRVNPQITHGFTRLCETPGERSSAPGFFKGSQVQILSARPM